MRRTILACVLLLAAACSSKSPRPSATPSATTAPTATPKADAHAVDVSTLLRPGTKVERTIYADMNADGTEEIAVWSQATTTPPGAILAQSYIDVFSHQSGKWTKIFDAATYSDGPILQPEANGVSQQIAFFQFAHLGCGSFPADLVVGVLTVGAGEGPLDVWVLSSKQTFKTEFHYTTARGGSLDLSSGKAVCGPGLLTLRTGDYKPSDAMCCPSAMVSLLIERLGDHIGIGSRTSTPTSPQP